MRKPLRAAVGMAALLAAGLLVGSLWLEGRDVPLAGNRPAPETGPTSARAPDPPGARPRVEVLNGFGRPGAARRAAERLRDMGFDVVYWGNAAQFDHRRTRVLRRSADSAAVRRLADSLGVASVAVRPAPRLHLDGTVVLGSDWDSLRARRDSLEAARRRTLLDALLERVGL